MRTSKQHTKNETRAATLIIVPKKERVIQNEGQADEYKEEINSVQPLIPLFPHEVNNGL